MGSVRNGTSVAGSVVGLCLLSLGGAGCGHGPPGAVASAAGPGAAVEPSGPASRGQPGVDGGVGRRAGEATEVAPLAWARLSDTAPLVRALARAAGVAGLTGDESEVARALLGRVLGLDPALGAALDLRRAALVALLPPQAGDDGPPLVALVPVTSREAVTQGATRAGLVVEQRPWGVVLRPGAPAPPEGPSPGQAPPAGGGATPAPRSPRPDGSIAPQDGPDGITGPRREGEPAAASPIFVAFAGGYAAVSFREERAPRIAALLLPLLARAPEAPLSAHLDVARLYRVWGASIEGALGRFSRASEGAPDPQIAFALRGARRLLRFADSVEGLDLLVGADDDGVSVTARATGRSGGAFAQFAASQQSGPPWGLELLPSDTVITYATRRSAATAADELDAAVALVGDSTAPPLPEASRRRWRQALGRVAEEMSGEMIYAAWPGPGGGVGAGGAFRVRTDPAGRGGRGGEVATRARLLEAYRSVGDHLGGLLGRALQLDGERCPLRVRVRPAALRVGGRPADAVEVTARWPSGARPTRRLLRRMVGEPLRMLLLLEGDRVLFALGADAPARLRALQAAARGGSAPSLAGDPRLRAALAFHPEGRVSLSFLPTRPMARFLGALLHTAVASEVSAQATEAALADAGDGAIVATSNAQGDRYEISTRLPASSLPGLPRIGGVLWRMALSPLVNPPTMPPLPLPPAHLPPLSPASQRPSATAPSQHL